MEAKVNKHPVEAETGSAIPAARGSKDLGGLAAGNSQPKPVKMVRLGKGSCCRCD
jgi:hypothetical protein